MESYKLLNLELTHKVKDLRNEVKYLTDLVTELKSENLEQKAEIYALKAQKNRNAAYLTEVSAILLKMTEDPVGQAEGNWQHEMSKSRYSVAANISLGEPVPKSSPEKQNPIEGASVRNVTLRCRRRRNGSLSRFPVRAEEQFPEINVQDMSIDEQISEPETEGEAQIPAVVPEENMQIEGEVTEQPKNLTTINEESTSKLEASTANGSNGHQSLLNVTPFMASTPCIPKRSPNVSKRPAISPIVYNDADADEECKFTKKDSSSNAESQRISSPYTSMPGSSNVTVRRNKPRSSSKSDADKENTHTFSESSTKQTKSLQKDPRKRTTLREKTNLTEEVFMEGSCVIPIKVEDLDNIPYQRPKRKAAPQSLVEPSLNTKMRRT